MNQVYMFLCNDHLENLKVNLVTERALTESEMLDYCQICTTEVRLDHRKSEDVNSPMWEALLYFKE